MIIRTANKTETEIATGIKHSLIKAGKNDVFLIPDGLDYLFVTLREFDDKGNIVVEASDENGDLLDTTIGFDSCRDAYAYAYELAKAAELDEECVSGDIWDQESGDK